MNHAKDNYFRDNKTARAKKTKTASRTAQRVYALDAKTQRLGRGAEGQMPLSSCADATDGFLKVSFLPKLYQGETARACQESVKMQSDFYASLDRLTGHYGIMAMPTRHLEYPYNMALVLWDLEQKLKNSFGNFQEVKVLQEGFKTYLVSEEKFNTGTTLYYIPTHPIYQMLKDPERKKNAHLLLSVCSYLYHIAGIPYYREQGSYLYWLYEMHREWTEQDEDREENERYIREFDKAEFIGDCMGGKISNAMNLKVFEKRLNAFKSHDAFDNDCSRLANKAYELYRQFLNESIFRNAPRHEGYEVEETENESIGMEKYISFISDTKGWLYESLSESINNEFNEYASMDEPTIVKTFDGQELTQYSLDFESRLFALLDDLCELLYNYTQQQDEHFN